MAARSRQVTEDQEELEEHSSPDEIRLLLPSFSPFERMSGQAEFPEDIELADDGPLTSSVERVSPSESADFSAPVSAERHTCRWPSMQASCISYRKLTWNTSLKELALANSGC